MLISSGIDRLVDIATGRLGSIVIDRLRSIVWPLLWLSIVVCRPFRLGSGGLSSMSAFQRIRVPVWLLMRIDRDNVVGLDMSLSLSIIENVGVCLLLSVVFGGRIDIVVNRWVSSVVVVVLDVLLSIVPCILLCLGVLRI